MIAYFDTSGLVKLLVEEPGSDTAAAAWRAADVRVCCTVGFAEAAAAIARAWRMGRFDARTAHDTLADLETLWPRLWRFPVDGALAHVASEAAVRYGLRRYDATHLAAASEAAAVVVAADGALLRAASASGLATIDAGS